MLKNGKTATETPKEVSIVKGGANEGKLGLMSISTFGECRIPLDASDAICKQVNMSDDMVPKKVSPKSAFKRVCSNRDIAHTLSEVPEPKLALKDGETIDRVVWMSKEISANMYVIYRSVIIKKDKTTYDLEQPNICKIYLSESKETGLVVNIVPSSEVNAELTKTIESEIKKAWKKAENELDSTDIYKMSAKIEKKHSGIPYMRGTGGLRFLPEPARKDVECVQKYIEKIQQYKKSIYPLEIRTLDIYDTEAMRNDILKDVDSEINKRFEALLDSVIDAISDTNGNLTKDDAKIEKIITRKLQEKAETVDNLITGYETILKVKDRLKITIDTKKKLNTPAMSKLSARNKSLMEALAGISK